MSVVSLVTSPITERCSGALLPFRQNNVHKQWIFFAVEAGSCGELALMGGVGGRRVLLPYTVYKAINHVCYVRAKVIHVHYMAGEFS